MARYSTTITTEWDPETAFGYLAEFSNIADWDPSVVAARHLGGDPEQTGARYEVEIELFGRTTTMPYETIVAEPPQRLVFRSDAAGLVSVDTLSFEPTAGGGTRVAYDAELTLKGVRRLLEPALQLLFKRLGDKARDGLAERLAAAPPTKVGASV